MGFGLKKEHKKIMIFGFVLFFTVAFASLIFAGFQEGNPSHSIEKIYGPSFNVSGWINISFDEEPTDSVFSSFFDGSEGNSVGLEELLEKNPAYEHSCLPLDCGKDYSTINGAGSKSFILNSNESKTLGLKISSSQQVTEISSFSMEINSNASSSSTPQLIIDILDDNETDWRAHKPHQQYNEKNYGCFDEDDVEGTAEITTIEYCQEIFLPAFPQVRIGAELQEISGGNVNFKISINDEYCTQNISGSGEISCVISDLKTSQTQDFFVCIETKNTEDNNKYSVRCEVNNPCGFTGPFKGEYAFDFEIFAQTSLYDAIGNFILNNTEISNSVNNDKIEDKIISYIDEKYGGDCSDECVIPIRFISGVDGQEIEVSDISLSYRAGIYTTTKNIYDLIEDFPKISSDYQRFFIDKAGFSVPSDLDTYDFSLKLNNQEIFSEEIEVKDVPIIKSLKPRLTAAGFPETFIVEGKNANISSCEWDFGDNSTITTSINKVIHIYSRTGTYNLKITVTDARGFSSSRIFEINVSSPKDLIQSILNKMNSDIQNLKTDIQKQGLFQQTSLNSVLRIQNISSELEILEQRYEKATNESEYMAIVGALVEIKLPENIFKTKEASSFLFFPEKEYIDMDVVETIGGGMYESRKIENYKNAVLAWQQENIDLRVNFAEFSGEYSLDRYDSEIKPVVNIFEIKVDEKKDIVHDYYLIVPKLQGIGFNTNVEESGDFYYVNLRDVSGLNFYTTGEIDFDNLPAFVAPPIDKLVVTGPAIPSEEEKRKRVTIFILSLVFLVVAGIIAYVIIYYWYKKKYESYLFKNRNDLYNIVTYVNNSKKRGLSNKEIIKNLKKAGWSSEQMRYVMRKYEGKRTGLVELPLVHLMKKVKKENSHQKQGKRRTL